MLWCAVGGRGGGIHGMMTVGAATAIGRSGVCVGSIGVIVSGSGGESITTLDGLLGGCCGALRLRLQHLERRRFIVGSAIRHGGLRHARRWRGGVYSSTGTGIDSTDSIDSSHSDGGRWIARGCTVEWQGVEIWLRYLNCSNGRWCGGTKVRGGDRSTRGGCWGFGWFVEIL